MTGDSSTFELPSGHGSKDCWVLSEEALANPVSLLKSTMSKVHLRRTGRDLLSRTADNLYWLGRNAERAEGTIRALRSVVTRLVVDAVPSQAPALLESPRARLVRSAGSSANWARWRSAPTGRTACATPSITCTGRRPWRAIRSPRTPGACCPLCAPRTASAACPTS
jgi:A predicted alpha-helical domain with a conserved ER motif.